MNRIKKVVAAVAVALVSFVGVGAMTGGASAGSVLADPGCCY